MGLLGKLFEKKECAICGGEIGLLGNRKLEDGNMCKQCAKKLSPWFEDRRKSTVADIEQQLQYREDNKQSVSAFCTTRSFGNAWQLQIDDAQGKFMIVRTKDAQSENPDVLDLSQITGVDVDIDESRTEEKKEDKDGNKVSYDPPRYTYKYDFDIIIRVRHPYFDDMRFRLNNHTVTIHPMPMPRLSFGASFIDPKQQSPEYQKYLQMSEDIKAALLRTEAPEFAPMVEEQPVQPTAKFCTNCGSQVDGGKFCTNCGAPIQ